MPRASIMTYSDWANTLKTIDFNSYELIGWTYYHRQTYTSGSTLTLDFFAQAVVNPVAAPVFSNWKTPTLPEGWHFLIQSLRFAALCNSRETAAAAPAAGAIDGPLQDIRDLTYDGCAELFINDKPYGSNPLWELSQGGGPTGQLSVPGTLTAPATSQYSMATNGNPDPRAVHTLAVPIAIPPLSLVRITTSWNAAKTLIGGNTDLMMLMDGQLLRPR